MKHVIFALIIAMMVGCASGETKRVKSVNPVVERRINIYECVVNLISKEVTAKSAEKVCTNIFSRSRVN